MNPKTTSAQKDVIKTVDTRNNSKASVLHNKVKILGDFEEGFFFSANWRFPVPAFRRKYFFQGRQVAIEECGAIQRRLFKFSAHFLKR
jgi:hypothetical protein